MSQGWAAGGLLASYGAGLTFKTGTIANPTYLRDSRAARRATGTSVGTGEALRIDTGASVALVGLALINHNIGTSALPACTVTVTATDNADYATAAVTAKATTTIPQTEPNHRDLVLQFPSVSKRYWSLTFAWTGGGNWTPAIGELLALSAVTTLSRTTVYGSSAGDKMAVVDQQTPSGDTRTIHLGGPWREKVLKWADLTDAQRLELRALWVATKSSVIPFLWLESINSTASAATAAEQECIYGKLLATEAAAVNDDYGIYQPSDFTIRALGREVGS